MIGAILICIFGVLIVCAALRYQLRSTPTHLVITRKRKPYPVQVTVDWREVRAMEQAIYHIHWHRSDGSTKDGGFTPVGEELPSEAESYRDLTPQDISNMTMEEFDVVRRAILGTETRLRKGMFG